MNRKNRDVKFLIYQSLYIFVICIIAIKGADLNLDEVELKKMLQPGFSYIDTANNIVLSRNEFANYIKNPDEKYVLVDKDELELLKKNNPGVQITATSFTGYGNVTGQTGDPKMISDKPNTTENPNPPVNKPNVTFPGELKLKQYATNTITNGNEVALEVQGIGTINPRSTGSIEIKGEKVVTIRIGESSKTYSTIPNEKPTISIQTVGSMGEEARVSRLQSSVGFRVTIKDDLPGQLDVKFSGPVQAVNKGNGVYDITLKAFSNKGAFENYIQNRNEPYSVGFTVTVTDKKSNYKDSRQQSFTFGEW